MKAIAVVDKNRAIGYNGHLLYNLPSDLAHFKEMTMGHTIICGRKTRESMPRNLPGREVAVLSKTYPGGYKTIEELVKNVPADSFVCGGESVYEELMPYVDEIHITEVYETTDKADTFFPDFRKDFKLAMSIGPYYENGHKFYYKVYTRKKL